MERKALSLYLSNGVIMSEPVHSFKEFRSKYGLAKSSLPRKHHLTSVKHSIYRNKLIKKKKRKVVGSRVGIQNLRSIRNVPAFQKYRENVPAGFRGGAKGDYYVGGTGKGWKNVHADDPYRHALSAQGIPNAVAFPKQSSIFNKNGLPRKLRPHRAFAVHQTSHGVELIPKSNYVDSRFDIPSSQLPLTNQSKVSSIGKPRYQQVMGTDGKLHWVDENGNTPNVSSEFDLDKRKNPSFSLARGSSKLGTYADNVGKSYAQLHDIL